jgi:hypothetical protein
LKASLIRQPWGKGFEFDWAAADDFLAKTAIENPTDPISPAQFAGSSKNLILARLKIGDGGDFSSVDFIAYFNDLYIRQFPTDPLNLREQIADALVARADCADAAKAGVTQMPKFDEDRTNYRAYLALELYERENIRPTLGITDEVAYRFYEKNIGDFIRPKKVKGRLLTFKDSHEAQNYLRNFESQAPLPQSFLSEEELTLTQNSSITGLSFLPHLVFAAYAERSCGPFRRNSAFVVWIREANVEMEQLPFAAVRTRIRSKLEDEVLPAIEIMLARQLAPEFQIADRIEYKKYGLDKDTAKPWKS